MVANYKDWPDKLAFALWACRTLIRTSTGATPQSLEYGMEVVLPIEIAIPLLRMIAKSQILESEWVKAQFEELVIIYERRLRALHSIQIYQARISRAFNRKVKPRDLQEHDLALKEIRAPIQDPSGKFRSNQLRPYIMNTILPGELENFQI